MSNTTAHSPRSRRRTARGVDSRAAGVIHERERGDESPLRLLRDDDAVALPPTFEPAAEPATGSAGWKRLFDVVVGLLLLIACAPLMLVIAVVSKLSQPGPLLYCQERVGLDGQAFQILKFRSMRVDAERTTGPVFAVGNDPRCTRFGAWLRRSCCDELPQLINVVRGDMSLVGPRPERPNFVAQFCRTIPRYNERHLVRPGITGWAQVNGWRGDTRFEERLQFDLDYVRRNSVWFDLRVLLRTPGAILRPRQVSLTDAAVVPFPRLSASPQASDMQPTRTDAAQFQPVMRRAA